MVKTPRSQSMFSVVFLLVLGLVMLGCEQAEDPVGYTPQEPGSLLIEAGAEGASEWILVAPDGTEIHGEGDSLITWPQVGDYWLLWEPVEDWHSPQENPARLSYKRGDIAAIVAAYEKIVGDVGTLRIDSAPEEANAAWNLFGPHGFFAAGRGGRVLGKRAAGDYTVTWESVDGFLTPPQSAGELPGEGVLTLNADYRPVSAGAGEIDIVIAPAGLAAPWQLELDDGSVWSGTGAFTLPAMPAGAYVASWGPVDGYETPASQARILEVGQVIEFDAEYIRLPDPVGTIEINVTPDGIASEWVLESTAGARYEGIGDRVLEGVPVGVWTLKWSDVPGYLTPTQSNVYLVAGATVLWEMTYVAEDAPAGTLVVNPDPDEIEAPWQLNSGPGTVSSGAGDQILANLPVGTYELVWGDVAGYVTPQPATVVIEDGAELEVTATYLVEPDPLGTVRVDPNPDELDAPWQLESGSGEVFTGAGDSVLVDLPLGEYTLTWGEVEGFETPSPNPVTQTLTSSGAAVFSMR